jgi:hypothetical protein
VFLGLRKYSFLLFLILGDAFNRRGEQRRLSIFKSRHKNGNKNEANEKSNKEKLKCVSFPPGADVILQELFTHYPPCDGDTAATSFTKYSGNKGKQGQWKDDFFRKPQISSEEILEKVASLSSRLKKDKALKEVRINTLLLRCVSFV